MSQAALAAKVEAEDDDEWDDAEYALGAVALPLHGQSGGVELAAAGTRAGAEKAKATRAVRAGKGPGKPPAGPRDPPGKVAREAEPPPVGTAKIAAPVDLAAVEALKARRDKAAAKERLAKLPDHGHHVAPQGLNRLPKGFATLSPASELASPAVLPPSGESTVGGSGKLGGPQEQDLSWGGARDTLGCSTPREGSGRGSKAFACAGGPVSGSVLVDIGVLLELAMRAGLSLVDLAVLTRGGLTTTLPTAGTNPREEPARTTAQTRGLSPIAAKVQRVREGPPQSQPLGAGPSKGVPWTTVVADGAETLAPRVARDKPETSAAAEARARSQGADADEAMARDLLKQDQRRVAAAREEQVEATSRDAELAMELIAREAQEHGVEREAALAAQEFQGPGQRDAQEEVVEGKGKAKLGEPSNLRGDLEAGLMWEKKLAAAAWRGASQVAAVTLHANKRRRRDWWQMPSRRPTPWRVLLRGVPWCVRQKEGQ